MRIPISASEKDVYGVDLRRIFSSDDVQKKGIVIKEEGTTIEFWTATDLDDDFYYKLCVESGLTLKEIEKIRVRVILSHEPYKLSPEMVIYKDHIVISKEQTEKEIGRLLDRLEVKEC